MSSRFKRNAQSATPEPAKRRSFADKMAVSTTSSHSDSENIAVEDSSDATSSALSKQDNKISLTIFSAWKLDYLDPQSENHSSGSTPLSWENSPWALHDCPKCYPTHQQATLCVHNDGAFFCQACEFNGNTSIRPSAYRGSWAGTWKEFLQDATWSRDVSLCPIALEEEHELAAPWSVGCFAPAWDGTQWDMCWHAWCLNDKNAIEDAFIHHPTDQRWWRHKQVRAYPLGWGNVSGERIVLVNNLEDAVLLSNTSVTNVACLPPDLNATIATSAAWRVFESMEEKMRGMKEVVLALRSDSASRALEDELGRRLDRERCFRVRWRPDTIEEFVEELGPCQALRSYGAEQVQLMVEAAPPFPVIGIYELEDIEDRFDELYETGLIPGAATGWPGMDPYYTVKTGQWTAVTGIPGHGKSSWLDGLIVNLAEMHGWRFGLFSPENQPIERHYASLMEKKLCKPFSEGPTPRITVEEKNQTKRWLNDRFKVILPDEENGLWTLEAVLDLARKLVYRYGIRGLVIDPWNELDHSKAMSSGAKETNHISEALTKIRRFARLYDVHVWIVAHPTKLEKKADGKYPVATPYDISGGAHWRNKADNAVSVYRNPDEADSDISDIYIQKIRFKEIGKLGIVSLRSDKASGAYIDDIDQKKRQAYLSRGEYVPSNNMRLAVPRAYPEDDHPLTYDDGSAF